MSGTLKIEGIPFGDNISLEIGDEFEIEGDVNPVDGITIDASLGRTNLIIQQ